MIAAKETSKVEAVKSGETIVEITTDFGVMTARLYNSTPFTQRQFY